jgi:cytochrome c5
MQSKVSAEIRELITDDIGHIRFQNMHNGNSMTVPSQRLQMYRLRTDEWAARLYEGYLRDLADTAETSLAGVPSRGSCARYSDDRIRP